MKRHDYKEDVPASLLVCGKPQDHTGPCISKHALRKKAQYFKAWRDKNKPQKGVK